MGQPWQSPIPPDHPLTPPATPYQRETFPDVRTTIQKFRYNQYTVYEHIRDKNLINEDSYLHRSYSECLDEEFQSHWPLNSTF